jgi:dipeptidyl aminopeptidase/acylaminoacyl peptidase
LGVVYVVDAGGGGPARRMTQGEHNDTALSWSRDGEWLYFASDRTGGWQLHRLRHDDPLLAAEQVTTDGAISGTESPDGRSLFVVRPDRAGLWQIPIDRGAGEAEPVKVVADAPVPGLHHHWDVCRDGVVLARHGRRSSRFELFRLATGSIEPLITSAPEVSSVSLSVAPDCSSVLFGHVTRGAADLMIVEGFR